MNLNRILSDGQSRAKTETVVDYVGSDPERFSGLMRIFESGDDRTKQVISWPMSVVAERHPELLVPYLGRLVAYLSRDDLHSAVRRNIARLLQYVEVPRRLHAKVFSVCTDLVADPEQAIGVRCFALTAASRIAANSPPLMRELKLVAGNQLTHATPGLKVRIRRLMSA